MPLMRPARIESTDPEPENPEVRTNPGAGCIVIMLAFSMLGGIASYGIYSGIRQDRDIAAFTHESPRELSTTEIDKSRFSEVEKRLSDFAVAGKSGKQNSFSLTADDLNLLVAEKPALEKVRGTVWFTGIENERIRAEIAMPMNRLAFWKPPRYLNADCTMKVESAEGRIFLRFDEFDIQTDNPVPEGFLERMRQSDLLAPYKSNEDLEKLFESRLSSRIEGNAIITETKPADAPPQD